MLSLLSQACAMSKALFLFVQADSAWQMSQHDMKKLQFSSAFSAAIFWRISH